MQVRLTGIRLKREAAQLLPAMLGELLAESPPVLTHGSGPDRHVDLLADVAGLRWLFEVKGSSRPGTIRHAAEQLHEFASRSPVRGETVLVLVVPHMSPAGASTAEAAGVSWMDLSGNASIRASGIRVSVLGRPNAFPAIGRPATPFAPRSARVARMLLLDPERWWRQRDLVGETGLDDSQVSRVVRRLDDERLLTLRRRELRPADPRLLLDAWADDYRFDRHDVVLGHLSGSDGMDVARRLGERLSTSSVRHAFTGLPAAWVIDHFAMFRLATAYVDGDPREAAKTIGLRPSERGANVQLVGPNDPGVFAGSETRDGLPCVSIVQVYLDLLALPERAQEGAKHLRSEHLWRRGANSEAPPS
ncbi:MAG TPA: hypothetical protein VKB25_14280 [Conexibacter sp.]|nr:hypothetical protein [Conexibacter sp.]